jgi:hypothetical protein
LSLVSKLVPRAKGRCLYARAVCTLLSLSQRTAPQLAFPGEPRAPHGARRSATSVGGSPCRTHRTGGG